MAKETWKCQWCGVSDTHEKDMNIELVGDKKPLKKRYHKHCHVEYLKDKKFKEEEQIKQDALDLVLKDIYGVKQIPTQAWTLLQHMRNGDPVFGKRQRISKRYKEGYDYLLIKETFEYCSETIEYWNSVKNFDGFMGAFKYALSIVIDKIYIVEQRVKDREKRKQLIEMHLEKVEAEGFEDFETSYKKPSKSSNDLSDFLDD